MYEYLQGKLTVKNLSYVALDINGIGFKIYTTLKSYEVLNSLGEQEKLFIHTIVKEDDISFYGFKSEIEREFFRNCISISGVGAKKAIAILSTFNYSELTGIVKSKNSKELAKVPGIGVKKAEKIIFRFSYICGLVSMWFDKNAAWGFRVFSFRRHRYVSVQERCPYVV